MEKQKEITKNVLLGRLETSEDFKVSEKKEPAKNKLQKLKDLKITVRLLNNEDIKTRKLTQSNYRISSNKN